MTLVSYKGRVEKRKEGKRKEIVFSRTIEGYRDNTIFG
jgi:hypothetical protein